MSALGFLKKSGASDITLAPLWQREKDSNPHKQSQSLSCYPYTIPLFVPAVASTSDIIANNFKLSRGNFTFFLLIKKLPDSIKYRCFLPLR